MKAQRCALFLAALASAPAYADAPGPVIETRVLEISGFKDVNDIPLVIATAARDSSMNYADRRYPNPVGSAVKYQQNGYRLDCPGAYVSAAMIREANADLGTARASACVFIQEGKATLVFQGYFDPPSPGFSLVKQLGFSWRSTEKVLHDNVMALAKSMDWQVVETRAEGKGLLFE
jgi:hypothetical protein